MKKTTWVILIILSVCTVSLSGIWIYFQKSLEHLELADAAGSSSYARHYILISDANNSVLWQKIYESAAAAAAADAYLERIDPDSGSSYVLADYLRIAIASQCDGIILRPDGTEEIRGLIDEAIEKGIPVITVLEDDSDSLRTSFVGINSYQMADVYAELCLGLAGGTSADILLLLHSEPRNPIQTLVAAQLARLLEQHSAQDQKLAVTSYYLDSSVDFDSEESIRDLFVSSASLPDIMICMDEITTEYTCQALVEYNEVGSTDIIGFSYSDQILDAIEKELIPVTLALDTESIGTFAVNALEEFHSLGHASSYYSIDLSRITMDTAGLYMEEAPESGD